MKYQQMRRLHWKRKQLKRGKRRWRTHPSLTQVPVPDMVTPHQGGERGEGDTVEPMGNQ